MKRSAFDCLQRGFLSLRANSGLVWMGVLQSFLFTALFVLSLVPPVLVVGGSSLLSEDLSDPAVLEQWLLDLGAQVAARLPALALGLVASLLIGLLAVIVWAWFQGGIMGVLLAAEHQAHPEAGHRAGGWQWFRTFSLRELAGWGARNLWPFFWFFHVMITAWLGLSLVFVLLVGGAGAAFDRWGGGAAFGFGCGGTIPLLFLGWVLAAWSLVAQPAVALRGGAGRGSALGFQIIGRRLGASSLVLFLVLLASVVLALIVTMGQVTSDLFLPSSGWIHLGVYVLSTVAQWLVGSVLTVLALATYTALVAAEAEDVPR